jgi:hypothetical protein
MIKKYNMEPVSMIFLSKNLLVGIAKYFNIVESVDAKIDKLMSKEYDSAIALLRQISAINNQSTRHSLLIGAIDRFNQAIRLEKRERLLLSYLGLMMSYYYIGEYQVICNLQDELRYIEFDANFLEKYGPDIIRGVGYLFGAAAAVYGGNAAYAGQGAKSGDSAASDSVDDIKAREKKFENLKKEILLIHF